MCALPTWLRISPFAGLLVLLAAFATACADDGASSSDLPGNQSSAAGTHEPAADLTRIRTEESVDLGSEGGLEPIYWRTQDSFQSVIGGEPYKVVVRVTNGYEEETLAIMATRDAGEGVTFTAKRAEVGEGEDPGSFYVFQLLLPEAGLWQVTTAADKGEISIEVKPAT